MKNWKTNLFGLALVILAVILFYMNRPVEGVVCLTTAGGFFNTKDNTTTGVGTSARTEREINQEYEDRHGRRSKQ